MEVHCCCSGCLGNVDTCNVNKSEHQGPMHSVLDCVQNINHSTVSYSEVLSVFKLDEKGRGSEVKCANCAKAVGNVINAGYERHKGCFDCCSQRQWFLSN